MTTVPACIWLSLHITQPMKGASRRQKALLAFTASSVTLCVTDGFRKQYPVSAKRITRCIVSELTKQDMNCQTNNLVPFTGRVHKRRCQTNRLLLSLKLIASSAGKYFFSFFCLTHPADSMKLNADQ